MPYKSPEARGYIDTAKYVTHKLGVEQDSVIVGSGAMFLGAHAVDKACRPPQDLDLTVSPPKVEQIVRALRDNVREVNTQNGRWYNAQLGNLQIDFGGNWDSMPFHVLHAGAQVTPEGLAFASLRDVRRYKEGRLKKVPNQKDRDDIGFIDDLLGSFSRKNMGFACTAEAVMGNTDATRRASLVLPGSLEAPVSKKEAAVINRIGDEGLKLMGVRYGTGLMDGAGYPGYRFDPVNRDLNEAILWWNTRRHGAEVCNDARSLAYELKLGELAFHTFGAAGSWHDVIQRGVIKDPTNRDGTDELMSAQELVDALRRMGVSQSVAFLSAYFIQGTQVMTEGSRVTGQAFAKLEFPTKEARMAAAIGSSADMGRIYRGTYAAALGLFPNRLGIFPPDIPDLSNPKVRKELGYFLEGQLGFLGNHKYTLEEAERLFAKNDKRDYRSERLRLAEGLWQQQQRDETPDNWWDFVDIKNQVSSFHQVRPR